MMTCRWSGRTTLASTANGLAALLAESVAQLVDAIDQQRAAPVGQRQREVEGSARDEIAAIVHYRASLSRISLRCIRATGSAAIAAGHRNTLRTCALPLRRCPLPRHVLLQYFAIRA